MLMQSPVSIHQQPHTNMVVTDVLYSLVLNVYMRGYGDSLI